MKAYELLKDGQMVHVFRSTTVAPDGREEHLTKGEVGHAGQVFTALAQHEIDAIEAGEREGTWRVVDLPDPSSEAMLEPEPQGTQDDTGGSATSPSVARRGRGSRSIGTEE